MRPSGVVARALQGIDAAHSKLHTVLLRRAFCELGKGSRIDPPMSFANSHQIRIGLGVQIRKNATLDGYSSSQFGIQIGDESRIKENVILCAYGGSIELGRRVLIGQSVVILGHGGVVIGDLCGVGGLTFIASSNHAFDYTDIPWQEQSETMEGVVIGSNAYIGARCLILDGVTIGESAVVGGGSVVVDPVEPYTMVAGNPARLIRRLK